ncbi:hypothetical protein DYJ31_00830 [Parvimonas micra]|nr:hypothetical protein DYJ31_00830 [Parvimonas micra]
MVKIFKKNNYTINFIYFQFYILQIIKKIRKYKDDFLSYLALHVFLFCVNISKEIVFYFRRDYEKRDKNNICNRL